MKHLLFYVMVGSRKCQVLLNSPSISSNKIIKNWNNFL